MVKISLFLVFIFTPFSAYADSPSSKIIIYGESHRSPHAKPVKELLKGLANQGLFYLALEAYSYGPVNSSQNIYGIEDTLPILVNAAVKSYVALYRSLHSLRGEGPYLGQNAAEFVSHFVDQDPLVIKIWQKIPRPLKKASDEDLALIFDRILTTGQPKPANDFFRMDNPNVIDFRNALFQNPDSFMRVAEFFAIEAVKYVEGLNLVDISLLYDFLKSPDDTDKETAFAKQIAVQWRDSYLSKNILKIYELAKKDKKDLIIVVGLLHLENLKKSLQSSNSEIEVETLKLKSP